MSPDPGGQILSLSSLCIGVITGSEDGYKEVNLADLPGIRIYDGDGLSGIVDKELFPGSVLLSESDIKLFDPLAVKFAKLTVLVAFWVCLFVLIPQELKRHPFPFELREQIVH